tara:strand:+ start:2059 stop:2754 length:696 start_codon:yes stop_codon:yes gene_type:complete
MESIWGNIQGLLGLNQPQLNKPQRRSGPQIDLDSIPQTQIELPSLLGESNRVIQNIVSDSPDQISQFNLLPPKVKPDAPKRKIDTSWRQNKTIQQIIKENPIIGKMIAVESSGNPNAVNKKTGAAGLMQIMKDTAEKDTGFGVNYNLKYKELFDPVKNVEYGTKYFKGLQKYYGNDREALIAYNWGHGNYESFKKLGYWIEKKGKKKIKNYKLPKETKNYSEKILGVKNRK